MRGTLNIVATPIGNLEDITFRAVRVLKEVSVIFAEDTRTTGMLLKKYEIQNNLESYNSINQEKKNYLIKQYLEEGKDVALVSDAGTPGISDPGYSAVAFIRKELGEEAKVVTIPGPSAVTAFLSAVGTGTHAWTFYGFLPHKNGRKKAIREMLLNPYSGVFYESTHRLEKCLMEIEDLSIEVGIERKVVVGKELTKIHENYFFGKPLEVLKILNADPNLKKGEFVVMIV
jgi:16S rRNA (cytidine1402-2'-O)-methyltransferase